MHKEKDSRVEAKPDYDENLIKARWSSFKLYNGYRIIIALTLFFGITIQNQLTFALTISYIAFSLLSAIATWLEKPKLDITLPIQILADIGFILVFMDVPSTSYAGMGLLLIIVIAAASLTSDGRLSLFYAAVATIGILLQQFVNTLFQSNTDNNYSHSVTLSIACFAIAWLACSLANRLRQSQQLALQRGLDLKDLAQINALITQRMSDGVIIVDNAMFIKHHNLQAGAFLHLENHDLAEKSLASIAPEIATLITPWFKDNTNDVSATPNISKVNVFSHELRVSFLAIAENRQQGAVVFIEDWSQIQTQSHQVRLAALGRLTAKIAHEIRNPLSSISHANQLLQEDEGMPAANSRLLQIIDDNVLRLDQIIKDVLELNRRDRTNQETIQLHHFITDFHQQFCAVENIPTQYFVIEINGEAAQVSFDGRHLNQILWNLCQNGWRHSQQHENSLTLSLHTSHNTTTCTLEIIDDGNGVPDDMHNHLFEPFFTTEKTGTGLGLYISKELAEANGANLQYKPIKTGTKFVMQIKKATIES